MSAHIASLQQQVNDLWGHLQALRNGQSPFAVHPSLAQPDSSVSYRNNVSPTQSRASHPQFQGPTSSAFNLDVAKSSLQTMGITQPEAPDGSINSDIDPTLGSASNQQAPVVAMISSPHKDPLWQISKNDAIRLCRLYNEEIGMMYPILDIEKILTQAIAVFSYMEVASSTQLANGGVVQPSNVDEHDMNILKMVLASALMAAEGGQSSLARAIYESCRVAFECQLTSPLEIKGLILLVIVAEYHFQEDEEIQAYRVIGLATRLCLEMGLHRWQNLIKLFVDDEERIWAVKLFWSIYVLDRRWSLGTGLPFGLQDADITTQPEAVGSSPYLVAMISYSRLGARIWRSASIFGDGPIEIDQESIGSLDSSILHWHSTIPASLRFDPTTDSFLPPTGISRGQHRLNIILYLRTNQMRVLIYRPVLHSATTIMEHRGLAQTGVDVAKDTIRVLTRLNESTDIYTTQQVCFNYFLLSALAVMFLAVSHAPLEFSHQVSDEFYQALDLVKGFSNDSYIAKRLWKAISGLKEIGPRLGLIHRQRQRSSSQDPQSTAAMAMAGLAGHPIDEASTYGPAHAPLTVGGSPMNGQQMSSELTNLFEAAKVYGNGIPQTTGAQSMEGSRTHGYGVSMGDRAQAEGEFSRIIGDLF